MYSINYKYIIKYSDYTFNKFILQAIDFKYNINIL